MNVTIVTATKDPIDVISLAAGTCYGKEDVSPKRVRNCFNGGHMSVFEHASATFDIDGISRACSHQLVRHRLASFSQRSQRYCKVDVESDDWYVVPPAFESDAPDSYLGESPRKLFDKGMVNAAWAYQDALNAGIRPEDARFLLPEATKTRIMVTMNCRELFHFLDLRQGKGAQWEILTR